MAQKKNSSLATKAKLAVPLLSVACLALVWPWSWIALTVTLGSLCVAEVVVQMFRPRHQDKKAILSAYLLALLGGFIMMGAIRFLDDGVWYIALIAVPVMACDVFAQLIGRRVKAHGKKFFPSISPKKTLAGAIAGYIGGAAAGLIVLAVWVLGENSVPIAAAMLIILTSPALGIAGDLLESKTKRIVKLDDFSNWLPGHGGFNDRLDALNLAFFVVGIFLYA